MEIETNMEQQIKYADAESDLGALNLSLENILQWHDMNDTRLIREINDGLTLRSIRRIEDDIGYKFPEELVELYKWRNGTNSDSQVIWYHRFIPLEEAAALRKTIKSMKIKQWEDHWFPIFEYQGEYYFIKLDDEDRRASPVYIAFPYQSVTYSYTNLTTMAKTASEVLASGEIIMEDTGYMVEEDVSVIRKIYEKYNMHSSFPYRD